MCWQLAVPSMARLFLAFILLVVPFAAAFSGFARLKAPSSVAVRVASSSSSRRSASRTASLTMR